MAANDGFNGTTVKWPSTSVIAAPVIAVSTTTGGDVPTPGAGEALVFHEASIPDVKTTIEIEGPTAFAKGDVGALAITWSDSGTAGSIASAVILESRTSGGVDGPVTSTVVFGAKA